jgi:DUF1365 family protein
MRSALYSGQVMHLRLRPVRHQFRYRIFTLLLDLDELPALDASLHLFSHNRRNLFSFYDRDHGLGDGAGLKAWVQAQVRAAGLKGDGAVLLQCLPRMFGYVFNPLSTYYCYDRQGRLEALLHQVSNTFGERHSYLLPVTARDGRGVVAQSVDKALFVSPFNGMDHRYHFQVRDPDEHLSVVIRQTDAQGNLLFATIAGDRRPLRDSTLFRCFLGFPAMTLSIMAAIHWHALRLWIKGVPLARRAAPPPEAVSIQGLVAEKPGFDDTAPAPPVIRPARF